MSTTPIYNYPLVRKVLLALRNENTFISVFLMICILQLFFPFYLLFFPIGIIMALFAVFFGFNNDRTSIETLDFTNQSSETIGKMHAEYILQKQSRVIFLYKLILVSKMFYFKFRKCEILVPDKIRKEILSFVKNFNLIKPFFLPSISYDQVIQYHLLADSKSACTCILTKDENGNVIFGRNLDWCSFGSAGDDTVRLIYDKFISYGIAGLFGVITGTSRENESPFVLAMNVSPGQLRAKGIPSSFINRLILEADSQQREMNNLETFLKNTPNLSNYHITVSDGKKMMVFSFVDESNSRVYVRTGNEYIFTVNFQEPNRKQWSFDSPGRINFLEKLFSLPDKLSERVQIGLSSEVCNTLQTVHSMIFKINSTVQVSMRVNNGFAGLNRNVVLL